MARQATIQINLFNETDETIDNYLNYIKTVISEIKEVQYYQLFQISNDFTSQYMVLAELEDIHQEELMIMAQQVQEFLAQSYHDKSVSSIGVVVAYMLELGEVTLLNKKYYADLINNGETNFNPIISGYGTVFPLNINIVDDYQQVTHENDYLRRKNKFGIVSMEWCD
jgi:hypothetical protein